MLLHVNSSLPFEWIKIAHWFGGNLSRIFAHTSRISAADIEEIRLRIGQPLLLQGCKGDIFLNASGNPCRQKEAYYITHEDLALTLERLTQSSLYAAEEKLKQGFLTLPGGHRVGVVGEAVLRGREIQTLKHISALNFRLAREIRGRARELIPYLLKPDGELCHTLILSAPRAGKTTLLRDLICFLSSGVPELGLRGQTLGVVDERGELAGMHQGIPTYDLGPRTDILDGCPKAIGMSMLVRSMAPQIIAVDELGHVDDVQALTDAIRTGVKILATAHASSREEALERPTLAGLFKEQVFSRIVLLNREQGPGTIAGVYDTLNGRNLYTRTE
ncbi:stage III sporulation protein AA [Paradesulfitobacterium ferrireducens]|uniref:stage III sporulation protein AA n=1 Tax=Paradesulfitobacterium ferrireducens TaxID=2816476 RepID=UPI001F2F8FF5|nr:stage III sporulation protein AA [Paradesulfitobacterium ferrireducens]